MGFWEQYFYADSDWRQRRDINRAVDTEALDIAAVNGRIDRLTEQLRELSLTLAAMMKVMSEMGQLDPRAIQMRVEAELEAMRPPPRTPNAPHPTKAPPPEVALVCEGCGKQVSSTHTTITERGTLCDACART